MPPPGQAHPARWHLSPGAPQSHGQTGSHGRKGPGGSGGGPLGPGPTDLGAHRGLRSWQLLCHCPGRQGKGPSCLSSAPPEAQALGAPGRPGEGPHLIWVQRKINPSGAPWSHSHRARQLTPSKVIKQHFPPRAQTRGRSFPQEGEWGALCLTSLKLLPTLGGVTPLFRSGVGIKGRHVLTLGRLYNGASEFSRGNGLGSSQVPGPGDVTVDKPAATPGGAYLPVRHEPHTRVEHSVHRMVPRAREYSHAREGGGRAVQSGR